jgi:nucleoside-diphosphate-sugar epimerase
MEKDDFRHSLSFGDDVFGGPDWKTMVEPDVARRSRETAAVPLLVEEDGTPVKRNFVHVDDLVEAIAIALTARAARQKLYNIAMDEPVDYGAVAAYLAETRNLPSTTVRGPYVGNWLDNSRAKAELGWRPAYDLKRLIDSAWDFVRPPDDPRRIWYPG